MGAEAVARLTRSLLFVPGSRPAMFAKAAASAADAVCLDLEDGVAPAEKSASRGAIVQALNTIDFRGKLRLVRINSIDTAYAYRDLIEVVEGAGAQIDLIMLPKASSAHDVAFVDTLLTQIEAHAGLTRAIGIEAQIESASGFVHLREIGRSSKRLEALILGPGDYAASMGMPATAIGELDANDALYPGHRYHAVMHELVAVARANGLRAIDGPYSAYQDAAGFERSCCIARAMGFDGKQCIHPSQVTSANTLFGPTADEVAAATAVVRAVEAAIVAGHGAATHDGRMIDAASLRMARAILDRHERARPATPEA